MRDGPTLLSFIGRHPVPCPPSTALETLRGSAHAAGTVVQAGIISLGADPALTPPVHKNYANRSLPNVPRVGRYKAVHL